MVKLWVKKQFQLWCFHGISEVLYPPVAAAVLSKSKVQGSRCFICHLHLMWYMYMWCMCYMYMWCMWYMWSRTWLKYCDWSLWELKQHWKEEWTKIPPQPCGRLMKSTEFFVQAAGSGAGNSLNIFLHGGLCCGFWSCTWQNWIRRTERSFNSFPHVSLKLFSVNSSVTRAERWGFSAGGPVEVLAAAGFWFVLLKNKV